MVLMSQCDYVIAHNDLMVKKLKTLGCTSKLIPFRIFDYDCSYPHKRRVLAADEQIKVTFAGFWEKQISCGNWIRFRIIIISCLYMAYRRFH